MGCYSTNPYGKGIKKPKREGFDKIALSEILSGKHPQYQTNKIRVRLIKEGIKEQKCEVCGIIDWNGKPVSFELDHIDGNSDNNKLSNLRLLCPNCHSQTETYGSKGVGARYKKNNWY